MDPINLGENMFDMVFAMLDARTWKPEPLPPKFGSFGLFKMDYSFNELGFPKVDSQPLKIRERDLSTEENSSKWGVFAQFPGSKFYSGYYDEIEV